MDCRVVVEAAVPVYDVETTDEAVRIAIAKTGEMLNPDLNYVEIDMGSRSSPSGESLPPAFLAADEALVALELEMTVFSVEQEEHASRIARKEIGQRLEDVPLKILEVDPVETDDEGEGETATDRPSSDRADDDRTADDRAERDEGRDAEEGESTEDDRSDDDLLPEFEDLVEDS